MKIKLFHIFILTGILILLTTAIFKMKKVETSGFNKKISFEQQIINLSYHKRDSLLMLISMQVQPLLRLIGKMDSINLGSTNYLITCLPDNACWTCLEEDISELGMIKKKYRVEPVIVCSQNHIRNLRLYLSKEQLNLTIFPVVNSKIFPILSQLKQNLFFIIFEPDKQFVFPYLESKNFDALNLFISCYYENKNQSIKN